MKSSLTVSLTVGAIALVTALPKVASASIVTLGQSGDVPINADFDGDGRSDISVWRPSNGQWWTIPSSASTNTPVLKATWGLPGDVPINADFDGDGKADVAIWRPSNGMWWIVQSTAGTRVQQWGLNGDVPVPADYDGDGKDDLAVWRPSNGTWYLVQSTNGVREQQWGLSGDIPIAAQGDHYIGADFIVVRNSDHMVYTLGSAFGDVYVRQSPSGTETPVAAPFSCYHDTAGTFNTSNGRWTVPGQDTLWFGSPGDIPLPGRYRGSDLGMGAQRAVYRPSTGQWLIHDFGQAYCFN